MNNRKSKFWADLPRVNRGIMRVVVVFSEQNRIKYLRFLKPGFRHCFAYGLTRDGWLLMDPLSHYLLIEQADFPPEADLAATFRRAGWMALTVEARQPPHRLAPLAPFTCVEAVKRLLGLHDSSIRTPWQLFCHLRTFTLDQGSFTHYKSTCQEHSLPTWLQAGGVRAWRSIKGRLCAWPATWRQIMGGFFSSPSIPAPAPAPVITQAEDPSEEAARMARERRRRAQGETIATSYRGVGGVGSGASSGAGTADGRKTLLGE